MKTDHKKINLSLRIYVVALSAVIVLSAYFMGNTYFTSLNTKEADNLALLKGISQTLSLNINGDEYQEMMLKYLNKDAIENSNQDPVYNKIHNALKLTQEVNNINTPIYTLTYAPESKYFVFGVTSAENPYFKHTYDTYPQILLDKYHEGGKIPKYKDEHGTWLSAFCPIKNNKGQTVGVIQVDKFFEDFHAEAKSVLIRDIMVSIVVLLIVALVLIPVIRTIVAQEERSYRELSEQKQKISSLLEESDQKNKELEASEEELRQNSEELNLINEQLESSHLRLEENLQDLNRQKQQVHDLLEETAIKNKELETSEQELRQYAEELNSVNDKLAASHSDLESSLAQLELAKIDAEKANNSKTLFLANMSHEIRSPLNAIVGFSQVMVNQAKKMNLNFSFKENLGHIITAGQNLSELINNILDLSKIESGKMEILIESINFKQLFQGIFHINKGNARKKGIQYAYNYAPKLPEFIQSDRTKLNQIIMNLVSNAIKFTPQGKNISLHADYLDENFFMIKVSDEGIGIAEDRLDKVFESFEQADNTITRSFGGTGLGLAITKEMVEMLGGEIWVESIVGQGSTFFVKLPLIASESHELHLEDKQLDDFNFLPENVVLAIEDLEVNQQMLKALFDELNLDIHFAFSGKEGIEKVQKLKPDLVLMDIHMPGMDGMEATRRIREIDEFKDLPIVALSADAFIEQQKKAFEAGINEYVTKPIDFDKLLPVLSRYLKQDKAKVKVNGKNKVLPQDKVKELSLGVNEMLQIPTTNFEVIDIKLQELKSLCDHYSTPYKNMLDQIEDALFAGDTDNITHLTQKLSGELESV